MQKTILRPLLAAMFILSVTKSVATADGARSVARNIEIKFEDLRALLESRSARLESARLEQQAASERKGSLVRSFLPRIELHGSQESFTTGSAAQRTQPAYGAEISLNLFNGGRDRIESDIRTHEFERKTVQLQQVVSDELQETRKSFWLIVYSQEKQDQIEAASKVNEQNLAAAGRRIRSGVATESDRVEFEMKAVDLKREKSETQLKIESLKREFAVLMSFKASDNLVFPNRLDHNHDFEKFVAHEASDHDFLYKDDEIRVRQSELAADFQRQAWWPRLEAFAAHNKYNQRIESAGLDSTEDRQSETVLGLRLRMEIGGIYSASREASAFTKEALAVQKRVDIKKRQSEAHLESELSELRFLHDQVHDAEANIVRAERYYKLTQSEYARGVKNSPDVLGASEKLFENRLKRLEIIKDFQIAKSHVLAKIGR